MINTVADLHIHSHLSRATSKNCNLEGLFFWARKKGIGLVGSGDCTHPLWLAEMRRKLLAAGNGVYSLCPDSARTLETELPATCRGTVKFMITGEISSIYKRAGRVRKVHSLILLPSLECAEKLSARLDALGNIHADGRPILGLDPRELLEIMLECDPRSGLVPAHIWTPWFAMLGSKSGFDSPEECFGDLTKHIFAVETGLSSDPAMNWRVSTLDNFCLLSNSDIHSPEKLGRNANVFHCEPDYDIITDGMRRRDPAVCGGTIDMYPEEGKYHLDGHRSCGVCLEPEQTREFAGLCPVCAKPLTLGVAWRISELADHPSGRRPQDALPCRYIIPLKEILAELHGCGVNTKKVSTAYEEILTRFGPELHVLLEADPDELSEFAPELAEGITRLRRGQVTKRGGFDGEYGAVGVFPERNPGRFSLPPLKPEWLARRHELQQLAAAKNTKLQQLEFDL